MPFFHPPLFLGGGGGPNFFLGIFSRVHVNTDPIQRPDEGPQLHRARRLQADRMLFVRHHQSSGFQAEAFNCSTTWTAICFTIENRRCKPHNTSGCNWIAYFDQHRGSNGIGYPNGEWVVGARFNITGCSPELTSSRISHTSGVFTLNHFSLLWLRRHAHGSSSFRKNEWPWIGFKCHFLRQTHTDANAVTDLTVILNDQSNQHAYLGKFWTGNDLVYLDHISKDFKGRLLDGNWRPRRPIIKQGINRFFANTYAFRYVRW